jgi:DNA-binding transcriptional LysR family regulator
MILKYEEMLDRIHSATNGIIGRICIGFLSSAENELIYDFLLHFASLYPQIKIEYKFIEIQDLNQQLNNMTIDIAFSNSVVNEGLEDVKIKTVSSDHLCIILPADHPLAKKETICISDLSNENIISFSKENNLWTFNHHQQLFKNHNAVYISSTEAANTDTALFLCFNQQGNSYYS